MVFDYAKSEIANKLIRQLAATSPRSFVGIATMGGTNVNSTSGRLGGYLTEIQTPIQVNYFLYYCFEIFSITLA